MGRDPPQSRTHDRHQEPRFPLLDACRARAAANCDLDADRLLLGEHRNAWRSVLALLAWRDVVKTFKHPRERDGSGWASSVGATVVLHIRVEYFAAICVRRGLNHAVKPLDFVTASPLS
jgi:hypothetical protein